MYLYVTQWMEKKKKKTKKRKIIFNIKTLYRGVVSVSVDLLQLDINQCDDDFNVPNAFKGTHKCDKKSSYVRVKFFYVYKHYIYIYILLLFFLSYLSYYLILVRIQ